MPLKTGYGKKTYQENVAELIRSGRDPKQANAIAWSQKRKALKKAGKTVPPKPSK